MLRAAVAVAALAAAGAHATSSGRFIFDCNARSQFLGCDQNDYSNYPGDRFPGEFGNTAPPSRNGYCNSRAGGAAGGSQEMHWTFLAERTDQYRVVVTKVGQPESSPVTEYQPGELLDVHVRVMQGNRMATTGFDFHRAEEAPYAMRPTTSDYWATAFRGIMLHWEKSTDNNQAGTFVNPNNVSNINVNPTADGGRWETSEAEPPLFHLPAGSCGDSNEVLMHATGGYKQTYNKFQYRAPNAGTGSIALRVLIKSGDANWGWFWWPNMAGDVVLSEGSPYQPRANTLWLRSDLGQSCDDRCLGYNSYVCNEAELISTNDEASVRDRVQDGIMTCVEPVWSGCGELGPTTSTNGECYFASPNCAAEGRDVTRPTCAASSTNPANGRRLCPCGPAGTTGFVVTGRTTTGVPTNGQVVCPNEGEIYRAGACVCDTETHELTPDGRCTPLEDSANSATPLATLAAAGILALSGASRTTLVVAFALLALVALSTPAEAHNWLRSKSRAAFASTAAPFPPRTSDSPHVMVTWDQKFQVEWVLGHTRETYWLITHSSNLGLLSTVRDADLDAYLDARPASQANLHLATSWRRWHRRAGRFDTRPETTNDWRNSDGSYDYRDFFANNVLDSAGPLAGQAADDRLPRSDAFSRSGSIPTSRGGTDQGNMYRLEYRDADLSLDARAKYRNAQWPWILEVIRCEHNVNQASRPDVVNIAITRDTADPTRTPGTGHYLANWRWRGYYDMVDIDLVDSPVPTADIYGQAYTGGAPYRRVEHATFANPRRVWPWRAGQSAQTMCTEFLGSAEAAIRRCNRVGSTGIVACDGVNIWPLYVPSTVSSGLVTNKASGPGTGFNPQIPWGTNASHGCNPADFQGMPQDTRIMAAVGSRMPFDDRVPPLAISDDPEDLVWHSTAFAKDTGRNFTLRPGSPFAVTEPDLSFHFGHKCISDCGALTRYTGYTAPRWIPSTTNCRNCDLEPEAPGTLVTDDADSTPVFLNSRCGGSVGNAAPYKQLAPAGSRNQLLSANYDCAEMTKRDPQCSDFYIRREGENSNGGRECYCLLTSALNNGMCPRSSDGSYTVYQVKTAAAAANPDPTCANGQRNTAGTRCCPSTCSQAECDSAANGPCYTNSGNTLSCTVRGAPCNLS